MNLKPLWIHIFAILLSAFKYKHKIAYAVLKMIVHKAKKKKTANKLIKQAYLHQKNTALFIWNDNK